MTKEQYEDMTLVELKEIAKSLEIKNISKLKKSELIDQIIATKAHEIKKDGVVLREKISPKNNAVNNTNREEVWLEEYLKY